MLKERVITALILFGLFLATLATDVAWPFALLTLVLIGAAGWEWARLCDRPGLLQWVQGAVTVGLGAGLALIMGVAGLGASAADSHAAAPHVHDVGHALVGFAVQPWIWWLALAVWVLGGAWTLRFGTAHWRTIPAIARVSVGLIVLPVAWLAMAEGRAHGINFLLSMLFLVWAADVGAYFGGRTFGKRKLAPTISPGKSWEGVFAGFGTVVLVALIWIWVDQNQSVDSPSLYSHLLQGLGPLGLVLSLVFLTAMSVVGDLFESLIKRQAGVKDSSQLLPGHGGVLDRIDALLPVLPIQMALITLCHG